MPRIIKLKDSAQTVLASSEKAKHKVHIIDGHWYFHPDQINMEYLKKTKRSWNCPDRGPAYWYDLESPELQSQNVAWAYEEPRADATHVMGYIGFWGIETAVTVAENSPAPEDEKVASLKWEWSGTS